MAKSLEKIIHQQVCDYLKLQYPNVIFTSDASGAKMSIGMAMELKRKRCVNYKIPDLLILQPTKDYKGLFLEIKKSSDDIFTKKGELRDSEHIQAQFKTIQRLNDLGYCSAFACGFNDAKQLIDNYFK